MSALLPAALAMDPLTEEVDAPRRRRLALWLLLAVALGLAAGLATVV